MNDSKRSRATGRVTLADVAHAAEVSPITASRALSGKRSVDVQLVERVREAARKLGYVPDPGARALASRHSAHVAILIPMLTNALFVAVLESAQRTLRQAGFQTLIGITHYDVGEEEQLLREQLVHRPAGVLVTGQEHTDATRAMIAASGIPCVHLMELSDDPTTFCVGFSQMEAGAAMTGHLLQRGRKRIAFAAAQLDPRTMNRMEGWRREMQAAGLYDPNLEWLNPAPSSPTLGAQMFEQIIGQSPPVDAIFFCNDDLAQGALLSAARHHIAVPEQIAIAGFNDLLGSDQLIPPLTTVRTRRSELGEAAATMLLKLIRGDPQVNHSIDIGFSLIVREST